MSTFWQDLDAGVVYTWIDEWIDVVESHTCRWRQRPEDGELLTEAVWDGRRVIYMDIYFCHAVLPHLTWNDHTVSLPFYSTSWTIHNVFCYCFMVTVQIFQSSLHCITTWQPFNSDNNKSRHDAQCDGVFSMFQIWIKLNLYWK